jgi:tRNA1(Val) A37 N6-methylase TrmN6
VAAILPAARAQELVRGFGRRGLRPARTRFVHPRAGEPASRVLVEADAAGQRIGVIELPLVVHEADGSFTAEVRGMLGEA